MNIKIHLTLGLSFLILFSLLFWHYPQLDLTASAYFYHQNVFLLHQTHWASWVRNGLEGSVGIFITLSFVGLMIRCWKPQWISISSRVLIFWLFSFILVPGIIVNSLLKSYWNRPRPYEILRFGGDYVYQKVWIIGQHHLSNSSFVCGDCAAAFAFFCLIPATPHRYRSWIIALVLCFAGLLGFIRLAQGGHFLSDVLLAYCIDYVVIILLYWAIFRKHKIYAS